MTNIEQKALEMISAARKEHPTPDNYLIARTALCRAIEQREAAKQELSDFKQQVSDAVSDYYGGAEWPVGSRFTQFIIPKSKPDPLFDVLWELGVAKDREGVVFAVRRIKETLKARGLEIREKGQ